MTDLWPETVKMPLGFRHVHMPQVTSTNEVLWQQYSGAGNHPNQQIDGLWLSAGDQTKGRGRGNNSWHSLSGNLFASVLLINKQIPPMWSRLPLIAGVALFDSINSYCHDCRQDLWLKWPNDIMIGEAKVGGILIEVKQLNYDSASVSSTPNCNGRFAGAVVGFGANCHLAPMIVDKVTTSLAANGLTVRPYELLELLAGNMACWLNLCFDGDFIVRLNNAWLARTKGVGQPVKFHLASRQIEGIFNGIDQHGRIIIAIAGQNYYFANSDIFC